jgi:hypothetical protein
MKLKNLEAFEKGLGWAVLGVSAVALVKGPEEKRVRNGLLLVAAVCRVAASYA